MIKGKDGPRGFETIYVVSNGNPEGWVKLVNPGKTLESSKGKIFM